MTSTNPAAAAVAETDPGSGRAGLFEWIWRLAPVAVGIFLRFYRVNDQLLVGDELHGISAAAAMRLPEILTTYLSNDGCIPMTALFRALMDAGLVLDERSLRLPSLLAGSLAPLVLPWMLEALLGCRAARFLAWLLAISPGLVIYSRIVRPYAIVSLLGGIAVVAFARWWREGRARWAWIYLLAAPLTGWLHLSALPFVGAPVALAWILRWCAPRPRRSYRELIVVSSGAAALVGAFILPPIASSAPWIRAGGLGGEAVLRPNPAGFLGTLQMYLGTTGGVAALAPAVDHRVRWLADLERVGRSFCVAGDPPSTGAVLANRSGGALHHRPLAPAVRGSGAGLLPA